MQDVDRRLDTAIQRRDKLDSDVQRILGKLESAKQTLMEVEDACRKKGIEPNQLEVTINKLRERYMDSVSTLETKIEDSEKALAPFIGDPDEN